MAGVLAVSIAALLIRLTTAPPLITAAYRMGLAFLLQAPFLWKGVRAELRQADHRALRFAVLAGAALAAHFASWVTSLKLTTVASSTVIVTTQPVWVALGSYLLLGEAIPGGKLAALAVALAGTFLIGWGDAGAHPAGPAAAGTLGGPLAGDLLALLGAVFMAVYLMAGQKARERLSTGAYTFLAYGVAALALIALALLHGDRLAPYPPSDWLAFAGLALVCTLGGHSLLNWALRHLPATTVSAAILGEPVGATLWAFLFLREVPGSWQLVGGLLVLAGLLSFGWLAARGKTAAGHA
ncbi:MAG: DMT family transporter [Methanocella sp.]